MFGEWIVPPNTPDEVAYLLWLVVGLVGLTGAAVVLGVPRMPSNSHKQDPVTPPSVGLGPMLPFGAFALAYLVFMIVVVPFTVHQAIDSRYLLPIYVPLLLAAVLLLDRFLSIEAMGRMVAIRSVLTALLLAGALAHIGCSAHENLRLTAQARGTGYKDWMLNSSYWEKLKILHYIRDNPINGRILSDNPYITWLWSRTVALGDHHFLPAEIHYLTSAVGDGGHVLWFRAWKPPYDYDELDIRVLPGVEPVVELSDGVIFRVTATEPFDAKRHHTRKQRYVQQLIEQAGELVIHADSTRPIHTSGAEQADEQVARAGWDVYRTGRKLTYHKQPCAPDDVQAKLILHVTPTDPIDLPADRQRHGFDNLGFYFDRRGFQLDDQCIAIAQLPAYAINRIRVGQWIAKEDRTVWEAEFSASR